MSKSFIVVVVVFIGNSDDIDGFVVVSAKHSGFRCLAEKPSSPTGEHATSRGASAEKEENKCIT